MVRSSSPKSPCGRHAPKACSSGISYCMFPTPLGKCSIAWSEKGIVRLQLPEASDALSRKSMFRFIGAISETKPPSFVEYLIHRIVLHLLGRPQEFSRIPLDLQGCSAFTQLVYKAAQRIPPGQTATYGELARRLGRPSAARSVGTAMRKNPLPILVPCHRVVAANGKLGGFSAPGGVSTKSWLLGLEGVDVSKFHMD